MPAFPGFDAPKIERAFKIQKNGFAESRLTMFSHAGTHMDAPAHMMEDGKTLDAYDPESFVGKAVVLDFSGYPMGVGEWCIELDMLKVHEDLIRRAEFVLIYTGWSRIWRLEEYFSGFPALSTAAARWLAELPLKGVGVDTISIDLMSSKDYPVHRVLMEKDILIIENLTNLEGLSERLLSLTALPLKFEDADGAPVRAVVFED